MDYKPNLPAYLAAARASRGWTLHELANQTALSVPYLSDLEHGRGEPSLRALESIANAYQMAAGDLLVEAGFTWRENVHSQRVTMAQILAEQALKNALDQLGE
jgi:transcriptional regulator with XRE-family HTH domain